MRSVVWGNAAQRPRRKNVLPFTTGPEATTTMAIIHTIKLPKSKVRNPLGAMQERKQIMRDRRNRRPKDARKQREPFEH